MGTLSLNNGNKLLLYLVILLCSISFVTSHASSGIKNHEPKFILIIENAKNPQEQNMIDLLKKNNRLSTVLDHFNERLRLPNNITVIFKSTDGVPHYNSLNKTITIPYQFMLSVKATLESNLSDCKQSEVNEMVYHIMKFVFYHECGHALIDVYQLPVVGSEEDAVDNLAAIISLEFSDEHEIIIRDVTTWLVFKYRYRQLQEHEFWDEHLLDKQRFYKLLCLTYAKDKTKAQRLLVDYDSTLLLGFLNEEGSRCQLEYQNQYYSWVKLLTPHLKQNVNLEQARNRAEKISLFGNENFIIDSLKELNCNPQR